MTTTCERPPLRLLILGGTGEASALAREIAVDRRFAPVLSLAGRTRAPKLPPIPYRIGGFGGVEGLVRYLRDNAVGAIVDATHPFATRMTEHARAAAGVTGLPLIRIDRPPWHAAEGERWIPARDMAEAAEKLGSDPKRVFLTVGQKELAAFRAAPHHAYLIRSVDPPAPETRPPICEIISATGPFRLDDEMRLLRHHGIELIVTKNSGGSATAPKLEAARRLKAGVIMVARPPTPDVESVPSAEAAMNWLKHLAGGAHDPIPPTRRGV